VGKVGEVLRQQRESRGLSLEDVRSALGIPLHYLQAMEGGKSSLVADEFYLIPFLRRYAEFLELDAASTVGQFLAETARDEARAVAPRLEMGAGSRWVVIVVVVLAVLAATGWLVWSSR
jgi:cytoskeleton protein RodZ